MRASSHNGRWGTPRHNRRDFDTDKAPHINKDALGNERYWYWDQDQGDTGGIEVSEELFMQLLKAAEEGDVDVEITEGPDEVSRFVGSELRYYLGTFSAALDAQNERHRAKGNHARVKTMVDWLRSPRYCPEESIMQIGNMGDKVDPEEFRQAGEELREWLMEWSEAHNRPFQILDVAYHIGGSEASNHAHFRRVWQYQDAAGNWMVGQNKALEAAGMPIPDPTQPEGKTNNRKMTFDAMVRDKWIEICESHGYQIEREPDLTHTEHYGKKEYIAIQEARKALKAQAAAMLQEMEDRRRVLDQREQELDEREQELEARQQELERREQEETAREQDNAAVIRLGRLARYGSKEDQDVDGKHRQGLDLSDIKW